MPTGATPIDDKNVKIPSAVKAAGAYADEVHRQAYNTPAETTAEPPPDGVAAPTAADPPTGSADDVSPPEAPITPAPVTPEGNEKQEPSGGWEHAYKSMKGRSDRATDTNRQLVESNRLLLDRVAELENAVAAKVAPVAMAASMPPTDSMITPQEESDYGRDFLGVVGKKAKEIVTPELAQLRDEVATLRQVVTNVGATAKKSAREEMKGALTASVPTWDQTNHSPEFHEWLALPDPYSGAIRHALLKDAWGRNDTARVLAFFKGFLTQEAAVAPAVQEPDSSAAVAASGKVPLETFAAPGRAKSAAVTPKSPAEKPIIKRSDIADFYRDVAAGKWRGRDKEKVVREEELHLASREGRVR